MYVFTIVRIQQQLLEYKIIKNITWRAHNLMSVSYVCAMKILSFFLKIFNQQNSNYFSFIF